LGLNGLSKTKTGILLLRLKSLTTKLHVWRHTILRHTIQAADSAVLFRFRTNMMATRAADLFMYMRATSSFLHSKSDKELMERMKRYLVDESEMAGADGGSGPAVGVRSSFGSPGTTSFSPKKPKGPDTRPAILARRTWVITIDKKRKIVTISGISI